MITLEEKHCYWFSLVSTPPYDCGDWGETCYFKTGITVTNIANSRFNFLLLSLVKDSNPFYILNFACSMVALCRTGRICSGRLEHHWYHLPSISDIGEVRTLFLASSCCHLPSDTEVSAAVTPDNREPSFLRLCSTRKKNLFMMLSMNKWIAQKGLHLCILSCSHDL